MAVRYKRKAETPGDQPVKKRKVRAPRKKSPLSIFREQTLKKRVDLKKARRDIDITLRQIEKDLGVLKRPVKSKP